jgi:hypothetical protein
MKILRFAAAAFLAASFASVSPAATAPYAAPASPQVAPVQNLVVPVNGCHAEDRRGYVPEFGRTVRHFHRRNCRPVRSDDRPSQRDCHRNAQRHRIPGYGGSVVHRHVGPNCRIQVLRRYDRGGRNCVTIGPIRYCEG